MKTKAANAPLEYKRDGIVVRIRPTIKDGTRYFVADYRVKGQRKLVWRSTLADARAAASDAVDKIRDGKAEVLELTSADCHVFLRARDAVAGTGKEIDTACREHAEILRMLAGRATPMEVTRDWLKRNAVALPKITVADAVTMIKTDAKADGKSEARLKQLANVLDRFAGEINQQIHTLEPNIVSKYLSALVLSERSKRNHRDVLGFFFRWLILKGYLPKGADLLEGVQNYSARKIGEIEIYSPDELARLIGHADAAMLPFIVIQAFAGLRHAEVDRLDWQEIDLDDGFIEVVAAKSKTGERRLVPMHDNLKAWLLKHRKPRGKVCPYTNTTKQLLKIAKATGRAATDDSPKIPAVEWKHNGLRHSFISYRVAETADVSRVADEAGNSVAIIRQHYLRRVKPAEASRWFAIAPEPAANVIQLKTATK
jgi:integrase